MVGVGCGMETVDAAEVVEESSELSDSVVLVCDEGVWLLCRAGVVSTINRACGVIG